MPGQAGLDKRVVCGEISKEGGGKEQEGDVKANPTGKAELISALQLEEGLLNGWAQHSQAQFNQLQRRCGIGDLMWAEEPRLMVGLHGLCCSGLDCCPR